MLDQKRLLIRKARERKGISQEAMALELKITQSNYGRLEKNDTRLTVPKIQKIAKVLDITIGYLFDEKSAKIINQHNNDSSQTAEKVKKQNITICLLIY